LLVEDDPEDVLLAEEAVAEIGEARYRRSWMQACELVVAAELREAIELLGGRRFDAILLDLTLPDSDGLPTFLRVQAEAPDTPVIVLASEDDEVLAQSLVRHGAQDYLIKSEMDCLPLARSLGCAIERNRLLAAHRSLSMIDELTGLYNAGGFLNLAERHWQIARRMGGDMLLLLVEVDGVGDFEDGWQRDLALIRVAEILRELFLETDVVARTGERCFSAIAFGNGQDGRHWIREIERRVVGNSPGEPGQSPPRVRFGAAGARPGPDRTLEDLMEEARRSLCENDLQAAVFGGDVSREAGAKAAG